ncbi:hypothetical protein [Endozoicomonas sp. 8E]|uniref:hypothetical protein n=1 Tax=Endozoicomonas sp. 8E TaxID=3035692 RepID=UPI0029393949|nr:hypothetical protein [Endozoicomonas sp. 8E]WOG27857.1 hypothetical protein P6910_25465 [Endozoicomonas sp. 8E]
MITKLAALLLLAVTSKIFAQPGGCFEQNASDLQKAEARCHHMSEETEEALVCIKIDRSKKRGKTFTGILQDGSEKRTVLKYLPFEIEYELFNCINGNERDNDLAQKIGDNTPGKLISFNIKTDDGNRNYKPSNSWQEQFIKCINQGLQNIFDDLPSELEDRLPGNKTFSDLYKGVKAPTTCAQFVTFMAVNSNSYRDKLDIQLTALENSDIKDQFITLVILNNNEPVHTFIHIGDNVCIGKIGGRSIYFHTVQDILSHYQEFYEAPLSLAIANIKTLQ